ncbi:transposase, IS605 OrfB family [Lyngbya aestuarii BL J]|uniref:Transposase, IS605 OrfB family n=1 Tax=Lyngbya aestuarii BL J TaxID=1348334 RepID=U7QNJ3_9CYAN|nr:RNA-guided endonuclease TnpB family protein [Lyngbya aestuarii]ERT07961.1 transposase, IS605 OrfB family [Lyngbya aestuarii BL J]
MTLAVRIEPTAEQQKLLDDTVVAFASACNWINDNVNSNLTNRNSIQAVCYSEVKSQFGLTANHVVRACARVGANRLTAKQKRRKVTGFKPTSFDCDARTFRIIEDGYLVSLSTTGKRVKVPMRVSNYHIGKLKNQNPTSAQVCKHKDGNFYLHIQLKFEAPKPRKTQNVIGVDFGRRDIAVTSTGQSWSGKDINNTRDKYTRTRASLQKKASQGKSASPRVSPGVYAGRTRSTRRRCREILKRLSGRERRYQTWLNHQISSSIITEAVSTNSIVAIEDLTGIRDRTNNQPRKKTEGRRSNSWSFYQLRTCLEYQGIKEGVNVIAIPPAYTSQTCHKCLYIHPVKGQSYRNNKTFKCGNCGKSCDADFKGSKMIKLWGASVTAPRGSEFLSCAVVLGLPKAHVERHSQCG